MADEDPGKVINYRFPSELHARAKALAAWKGQTLRVWITRALEAEADRQESERDESRRRR